MKSKRNFFVVLVGLTCIFALTKINCNNEKAKTSNQKIVYDDSLIQAKSLNAQPVQNSTVLVKLNYELEEINFSDIAEEQQEEYRIEMFKKQKLMHQKMNAEHMKKIDVSNLKNLYISSYSPFFSFDLECNQFSNNFLNVLSKNDDIEKIIVNSKIDYKPNLEMSKMLTGGLQIINSQELTGNGVVVGLLEPGIVDKNHENFVNTDLLVRDEWYYNETITEHASIMGTIIAGNKGIAPNAKLLSVELSGDAISEIDWLLDHGVNIINCSYGENNPTGIYSTSSAYLDYIVNQYKVTVVCAAGNNGKSTGYICNPGLGYNVITVGACSNTDFVPRNFSSYKVVDGPQKPNLIAPGYGMLVRPFGINEGTSLSTALTSGYIALLMEDMPTIKYHPELIRALIMANTNKINRFETQNSLNNNVGAGGLNFGVILDGYSNMLIRTNSSNNPNKMLSSFVVKLEPNQIVRAAMSWLAKADGNVNNTDMSEYDIVILDSTGKICDETLVKNDNVDFIEYMATKDDSYEICIFQRDKFIDLDSIGLAYRVI